MPRHAENVKPLHTTLKMEYSGYALKPKRNLNHPKAGDSHQGVNQTQTTDMQEDGAKHQVKHQVKPPPMQIGRTYGASLNPNREQRRHGP